MRKVITVLIGIIIIGSSAFGFSKYMKGYELDVTMMKTIKPVKMIQAGELITENMVHMVSIPTIQHMSNSLVENADIIGKRAIVPIGENEEFLSWKIGKDDLYPEGEEEYIGFKIDFVGAVNNMIRRGDKVDVWVEYSVPKLFDASGQEVDQTEQAKLIADNPAALDGLTKVYSKRVLMGLTVAYVKDQNGNEVRDTGTPSGPTLSLSSSPSKNDDTNAERYRQNASGQPSYITFIMSPDQYSSFAEGAKYGAIKLGLPATSTTIGTIVPSVDKVSDLKKEPLVSADTNEQGVGETNPIPSPSPIANEGGATK